MAKTLHDKQSETARLACVEGSFPTTAGATEAPATKLGKGYTPTKTAAGTHKVTFTSRKYAALVDAYVHAQRPTADNIRAVLGPYTAPTASADGFCVIYTVAEDGTPVAADPAVDANSRIHFDFVFSTISTLD